MQLFESELKSPVQFIYLFPSSVKNLITRIAIIIVVIESKLLFKRALHKFNQHKVLINYRIAAITTIISHHR